MEVKLSSSLFNRSSLPIPPLIGQHWINGEYITKLVDNETTSQPLRYGGIGMGAIWEAQAWFDNMVVWPLAGNWKAPLTK